MKEVLLLRPFSRMDTEKSPLPAEQLIATTNFILPSVLFRILVRVRSRTRIHLSFSIRRHPDAFQVEVHFTYSHNLIWQPPRFLLL